MDSDKLKILHLNTEKSLRGGELQMLFLAQELALRGHENHVILQENSAVIEETRKRNISYEAFSMRGEWDMFAAHLLRKAMERHRPNLIHAHTSHAGTLALLARRFRSIPPVVLSRRISLPLKKNPFTLYKYRAVDAVLAVSPFIAENLNLAGLPKDHIFVAESGTDFSRFEKTRPPSEMRASLEIPPQAFVIGNVGYFDESKGQLLLIQAFAQLVRRNPSVTYFLLLIGEGPTLNECRHFANRLDLSERILFPGYRKDVENYYGMMDLFFLSTLPTGTSEGWSGVIREAMACRVPVIALRQPSLEEQIRHNESGLLVSFNQLGEWVEAIEKIQADPKLRSTLAANAYGSAREFTIERLTDKTEMCYRAILDRQILREKPL